MPSWQDADGALALAVSRPFQTKLPLSTATDNGIVVQSSALAKFNGDANRDFLNVQRSDTCTPGQPHTYFLTVYATAPQTSIGRFVSASYGGRIATSLPFHTKLLLATARTNTLGRPQKCVAALANREYQAVLRILDLASGT